MSALPPITDIASSLRHVRYVPGATKMRRSKAAAYSIISSASNCV